jgi:hypothetical protein
MKVIVEELEEKLGKNVVVFVDRRQIAFPIEFDREEGWCLHRTYHIPKIVEADNVKQEPSPIDYVEEKVYGKVEVAAWETGDGTT